ncbi:MAG: bifunctional riboflavin kinase/FAD synthetase [Limnochordaceae bacterium]|nr:bifunctional riboflavin kinase/FAD synthetase [Limnochordaceae bacterium]
MAVDIEVREIVWKSAGKRNLRPGAIVALGTFDGVHRGHQEILRHTRRLAAAAGRPAVALTFDRHPRSLLGGAPPLLTTTEEKLDLLEQEGLDGVWLIRFDPAFSQLSPEQFVHEVLDTRLQVAGAVAGFDFSYGRGGAGKAASLQRSGQELGWQVEILPPVVVDGQVVSSTGIRQALQAGQVEQAARWLGRPYRLQGQVVAGDGRGRSLGFPTANLATPANKVLPADGVYVAVVTEIPDRPALVSISRKPTFWTEGMAAPLVVEVYVDQYEGNLYGQYLAVDFLQRLRPIARFDTVEQLVEQMEADRDQARHLWGRLQS